MKTSIGYFQWTKIGCFRWTRSGCFRRTLTAVSRSGYYAFVHRLDRPEKDAALAETIAQQRERSFRTYGYRRMWLWLKSQNIFRNPKTVLRIMKKYDLLSEIRRRRKWKQMGQQLHKYGNLLNRD